MRYWLRRFLPALALGTVFAAVSPSGTALAVQDETATTKTEVNLRARPDTTSTVKQVVPHGTAVKVVCWAEGEPTYGADKFGSMWLYVDTTPQDGWMHSKLLTPVEVPPCSEGTVALYDNCDEARDAGAAPVLAGSPGYGLHLDRDRDGVGCEWPY